MIQIFYISPAGALAVKQALTGISGQSTHSWRPDEDTQVIGVVEVGRGDTERVADALDAAGILILPDHKTAETISPEHAAAMAKHGVLPSDTTKSAMFKVHGVSGFNPLKPKRF